MSVEMASTVKTVKSQLRPLKAVLTGHVQALVRMKTSVTSRTSSRQVGTAKAAKSLLAALTAFLHPLVRGPVGAKNGLKGGKT
jgi:hypothetical protein